MNEPELEIIISHILQTVSPIWLEEIDNKQLPKSVVERISKLSREQKQQLLLKLVKYLMEDPVINNANNLQFKDKQKITNEQLKAYIYQAMNNNH